MSEKVQSQQLEQLDLVAKMPDNRMPKCFFLFASLPAIRPACDPQLRWNDVVHQHLLAAGQSCKRLV